MISVYQKMKKRMRLILLKNKPPFRRLKEARERSGKPQSVIFFTTHKCASVFMAEFFGKISMNSDYKVVDYAGLIWEVGNHLSIPSPYEDFLTENYDLLYKSKGEIYAPQRKPLDFPGRKNFKHIFFLRDPRDVLVSAFHSFGFSHALPDNDEHRDTFLNERKEILEKGIDDYVIQAMNDWVKPTYTQYMKLHQESSDAAFYSYDFFRDDTKKFVAELSKYLEVSPTADAISELVAKNEKPTGAIEGGKGHRRSGKSGQYKENLKPETVTILNEELGDILRYWKFI